MDKILSMMMLIEIPVGQGGGGIYIATLSVKIEGDKIYILHDHTFNDVMECEVYEKWEKIPEDWKKYKPDW